MDAEAYALARVEVRFSAVGNDERIHHLNKMTKRRLAGKKGFVSKYRSIHLFIGVAIGERRALGARDGARCRIHPTRGRTCDEAARGYEPKYECVF